MACWALISGEDSVDRATCALSAAERLTGLGLSVGGFIQRRDVDAEGRKGYTLVRLGGLGQAAETAPLAVPGTPPPGPDEGPSCSMTFDPAAFATAARWAAEDAEAGADLLVFGGVSRLEVSGHGHYAALSAALARSESGGPAVLFCARASLLPRVLDRLGLEDEPLAAIELPAGGGSPAGPGTFERLVADLSAGCGRRAAV